MSIFSSKFDEMNMREILTDQNLPPTAQFCLQTVIVTIHYQIFVSSQ